MPVAPLAAPPPGPLTAPPGNRPAAGPADPQPAPPPTGQTTPARRNRPPGISAAPTAAGKPNPANRDLPSPAAPDPRPPDRRQTTPPGNHHRPPTRNTAQTAAKKKGPFNGRNATEKRAAGRRALSALTRKEPKRTILDGAAAAGEVRGDLIRRTAIRKAEELLAAGRPAGQRRRRNNALPAKPQNNPRWTIAAPNSPARRNRPPGKISTETAADEPGPARRKAERC